MSFQKNNTLSSSANLAVTATSKYSNNKFAALFNNTNKVYNKANPSPSCSKKSLARSISSQACLSASASPFISKAFVHKAKNIHISGNAEAGPSIGVYLLPMKRADIVQARMATMPEPTNKPVMH